LGLPVQLSRLESWLRVKVIENFPSNVVLAVRLRESSAFARREGHYILRLVPGPNMRIRSLSVFDISLILVIEFHLLILQWLRLRKIATSCENNDWVIFEVGEWINSFIGHCLIKQAFPPCKRVLGRELLLDEPLPEWPAFMQTCTMYL